MEARSNSLSLMSSMPSTLAPAAAAGTSGSPWWFLRSDAAVGGINLQPTNSCEGTDEDELFVTVTENLLTAASLVTLGTFSGGVRSAGSGSEAAYAHTGPRHVGDLDMPIHGLSSKSLQNRMSSPSSWIQEELKHSSVQRKDAAEASTEHAFDLSGQQQTLSTLEPFGGSSISSSSTSVPQHLLWQGLVSELQGKVEVLAPEQLHAVRLLGGGAFGEVYLAHWDSTEVGKHQVHLWYTFFIACL